MASINKLAIRGVRSFSPEDTEQILEFFFPITIIVGANGCGKTTIIESLKYAITGGLPPGANSGRSFVHDPRSIGQQMVKASVKLRFTSKAGHPMVVVRSMELTQKKTTSTFRQLDGALRTQDLNGERRNISHKCTELDRQVPQLMGVSKAILDYVLFCHQEDSSWPLQDSAVIKKRFDEIFDSTRYTKAIEVLRKKEKSYLSLAKDIKADLAGLNSHKHAAQGFRNELETLNDSLEELDETKKEVLQQLALAEEEIAAYTEKIDEYESLENEIEVRRNELHQNKITIANQRNLLDEDLTETHTLDELKTMLSEFDENCSSERDEIKSLMQKIEDIQSKITDIEEEESKIARRSAQLEAERKAHESRLRSRLAQMETIAQTHALDLDLTPTQVDQSFAASLANTSAINQRGHQLSQDSVASITAEEMENFLEVIEKKDQELSKNLADHKQRMKAEDSDFYASIGSLRSKMDIIKNDLARLEEKKKDYQNELATISKRVTASTRLRKSDVEEARNKADALAKQLQEANQESKDSDISAKISNEERKASLLKQQIDDDRMVLETLRFSAEEQQNIMILKDQTRKEKEELEESLRENLSSLQKFNLSAPKLPSIEGNDEGSELQNVLEKLADSVRAKYDDVHSELRQATEELLRSQKMMSEKSALLASNQQTIASLKSKADILGDKADTMRRVLQEIRQHEANMGQVIQVNEESPRDILNYLDDKIESLQHESPADDHRVLKRVMRRLKRMAIVQDSSEKGSHMECPCCKTRLNTPAEAKVLQDALEFFGSELSPLVSKSHDNEVELKLKYEGWRNVVVSCMDDVRDFHRIGEEIREIERNTHTLIEDTSKTRDLLKKQEALKIDLEADDGDLRELLDLAKRWCDDGNKIVEKRMSIVQKQMDLHASLLDTGRDLKTVERDIAKKLEEKEEIASKVSNLLKAQQTMIGKITSLTGMAQRMEQLAREKEDKFAEERKNADRKAELNDLIRDILGEERKNQEQLAPLKNKIATKESEQAKMRALSEEEEERLSEVLAFFRTDVAELKKTNEEIIKYEASNVDEEKQELEAQSKRLADKLSAKKREAEVIMDDLNKKKATLNDQDRKKKQLVHNIAIIEATRRAADLEREKKELERKAHGLENSKTLYDKQLAAQQRKEKQQELKFRTEGRWSEIVERIRSLKRKLSSPEYKDIDERCRKTTIEHTTTLLAAEDLKKYYSAIDKALLMFHGLKITEINKIIRELWMMTYKGEDITNIEIVSGQESGLKAGKSYNYRVVMTKGSSEMDMRGRCSAGQRVLASIVIRLALAETFGINVGTLALDEPTVNLDHKNKQGLAVALAQIVASRAQQRNFQLVLITHDEDFVSMMKTELSSLTGFSMPEKYFQVRRERGIDGKYYSKIDAVDWDELV